MSEQLPKILTLDALALSPAEQRSFPRWYTDLLLRKRTDSVAVGDVLTFVDNFGLSDSDKRAITGLFGERLVTVDPPQFYVFLRLTGHILQGKRIHRELAYVAAPVPRPRPILSKKPRAKPQQPQDMDSFMSLMTGGGVKKKKRVTFDSRPPQVTEAAHRSMSELLRQHQFHNQLPQIPPAAPPPPAPLADPEPDPEPEPELPINSQFAKLNIESVLHNGTSSVPAPPAPRKQSQAGDSFIQQLAQTTGPSQLQPQSTGPSAGGGFSQQQQLGGGFPALQQQGTGSQPWLQPQSTGPQFSGPPSQPQPQQHRQGPPVPPRTGLQAQSTGQFQPLAAQGSGQLQAQGTGQFQDLRPQGTGQYQLKPQGTGQFTGIGPQSTGQFQGLQPQGSGQFQGLGPQSTGQFQGHQPQGSGQFQGLGPQSTGQFQGHQPQGSGPFQGLGPQSTGQFLQPQGSGQFQGLQPPSSGQFQGLGPQGSGQFPGLQPQGSGQFPQASGLQGMQSQGSGQFQQSQPRPQFNASGNFSQPSFGPAGLANGTMAPMQSQPSLGNLQPTYHQQLASKASPQPMTALASGAQQQGPPHPPPSRLAPPSFQSFADGLSPQGTGLSPLHTGYRSQNPSVTPTQMPQVPQQFVGSANPQQAQFQITPPPQYIRRDPNQTYNMQALRDQMPNW